MLINEKLNEFKDNLKSNTYFDKMIITDSYEYSSKPHSIFKPLIAVGFGGLKGQTINLGSNCIYGEYTIDTDIYVPFVYGVKTITSIMENICKTPIGFDAITISTSKIETNIKTDCYTVNCSFTFSDEIYKGEN